MKKDSNTHTVLRVEPPSGEQPRLAEPHPGLQLGRYRLIERRASGGMGEVWAAEQTGDFGFRRLVAVKTIRPEYAQSSECRRMLLDEARLASRIRHANVVEVMDVGEEGPLVYLVMTLIDGESLAGLRGRLAATNQPEAFPPAVAVPLLVDVLHGLSAAHELSDEHGEPFQIVHRDVSPKNILVGRDGVARLTDFGIAKALGRMSSDNTEAGQVKGTFSYMSPEQIERGQVTCRTDIFSTGVVLWECLSGRRLFAGDDVLDTITRVRNQPVPNLREIVPELPQQVSAAVHRALSRTPADRFSSAAEMAEVLEHAGRECGVFASRQEVSSFVQSLIGSGSMSRSSSRLSAVVSGSTRTSKTASTVGALPKSRFSRWWVWAVPAAFLVALAIVWKFAAPPLEVPPGNGSKSPTKARPIGPTIVASPAAAPSEARVVPEKKSEKKRRVIRAARRPDKEKESDPAAASAPQSPPPKPKFDNPY